MRATVCETQVTVCETQVTVCETVSAPRYGLSDRSLGSGHKAVCSSYTQIGNMLVARQESIFLFPKLCIHILVMVAIPYIFVNYDWNKKEIV